MRIKESMGLIVDVVEGLDDFKEVEVSVVVRRREGKTLFIRMSSQIENDGDISRSSVHEEQEDRCWF